MRKFLAMMLIGLGMQASKAAAQSREASLLQNEDSLILNEVVVTGTRVPMSRQILSAPVTLIARNLLESSGSASVLPALMQNVPGLFITSRGVSGYGTSNGAAGDITLRGFSSSSGRILILIDGHPQYAAIYGHPVVDSYMSDAAERVEVIRGSASVLYGSNAMGGAINIITRGTARENGNRLTLRSAFGSYGTRRYSINDSYGKGRLSMTVGGGYEKSDGHRINSSYENLSGHGRLGYDLSENWNISASASISHINTKNPGLVSNPMLDGTTNVTRAMGGISLENKHEKSNGQVNVFYNWGRHLINDGHTMDEKPQEFLFHSTDYMGGINLFQTFHPFRGSTLTGGIDVALFGGNAYRNPETEHYADHIKLHEIAGYAQVQQELGRFLFSAGLRLNNHKKYGFEWIPQAGINFTASRSTILKFSVSKGFRSPNLRELYMYASANEDLLPERSLNFDLSLSQSLLNGRMQLEVNLFHVRGDNIVQVVRTDGRPRNQNVGKFRNKGVEVAYHWNILSGLRLAANYSFLDMDTPIIDSPRHKGYTSLTYNWRRFLISAGYQWVGGLYLSTGEAEETTSYGLLDARTEFKASDNLSFYLKADNLLSRKYETVKGFPMPRATIMTGFTLSI